MSERPPARPSGEQIWRTCAEWAEVAWLAARRLGLSDPVVELWALDPTDPGRVSVAVAERGRMARKLAPHCPPAVAELRAAPPGRPFTAVILTPEGVSIDHRPAPDGRPAIPAPGGCRHDR